MEEIAPEHKDVEADILQRVLPGPPPFRWASLWEPAQINPLNGKSYTLPLLRLTDQYAINFHRESDAGPALRRLGTSC